MNRLAALLWLLATVVLDVRAQVQPAVPAASPLATSTPVRPATAIVAQDRAALRAAPSESAQQHAVLWAGDMLELRGARMEYLQVYDHRRERAGFVRATQLRPLALAEADAPGLLAVLRFLRDSPGAEALGLGYAAAYLKAAPAGAIDAEVFDALGTLAERLARRATQNRNRADDAAIAAQLEVAASYGVHIVSFEHEGRMQLCYDGEAFRRVLALPAGAESKARAALALTRAECIDPLLPPLTRHELDEWRADVLGSVPRDGLPDYLKNRLRMRAAGVWASVAFGRTRRGLPAQQAAADALQELAAVDRRTLAEGDVSAYSEAAVRVGAVRWAAEAAPAASPSGLTLATAPGKPGETCIELVEVEASQRASVLKHCTYGTVWPASARVNPAGDTLALAVQPLDGWRELWLLRRDGAGWHVDVVPPGAEAPGLGYIEFAGWVPRERTVLVARETKADGRWLRQFETLSLDSLQVAKQADEPSHLSTFYRWQDAAWKRQTVSLR
jgi:hypothetical protein